MKDYMKKWGLQLMIAAALLLILIPVGARISGVPAAGGESYFNLRMAHLVQDDLLPSVDPLQSRPYNFNLYHYFLAALLFLPDQMLLLSSILLALASACLLYMIAKEILGEERAVIAMLIFFLTPLYPYMAATITSYALSFFLVALSFFLYLRKRRWTSLLPATLTVLMRPMLLVSFFAVLAVYEYYTEGDYRNPVFMLLSGAAMTFIFRIVDYIPVFQFAGTSLPRNYLTDFGAVIGYSFFILLLAFVALIIFWKDIKVKVASTSLLLLLVISFYVPDLRLVMNVVLALYAALGFEFFLKRRWVVPSLKDLTLLILFSSLLFSQVSYLNRIAVMEPTTGTIEVVQSIKLDRRNGSVLSDPADGYLIEYFADKRAFMDDLSFFYSDHDERKEEFDSIVRSPIPRQTKELLDINGITYIYLSPEMKRAWGGNEELLLVLDVSNNFVQLNEAGGREAWLYIRI